MIALRSSLIGATRTMQAAAPATWPAPCHRVASSVRSSLPVQTMKSHGWVFDADGARQPASVMRSRSSLEIGWSVKVRTFRRARSASQVSMAEDYPQTGGPRVCADDRGALATAGFVFYGRDHSWPRSRGAH